jgi:hypothetical protein
MLEIWTASLRPSNLSPSDERYGKAELREQDALAVRYEKAKKPIERLYAAKDGETAGDGRGDLSPFTAALIKRLKQPLEINKLIRLVTDDVLKATNNKQRPFTYGSLHGEVQTRPRCRSRPGGPLVGSCVGSVDGLRA